MERKFKQIFSQHKGKLSDQWSLYIEAWDDIFSPYQNREISLLEIGIQNGGSLEIFAKYFPHAKHIIGCDIDENCQALEFSDPRITVITGDINSETVENRIQRRVRLAHFQQTAWVQEIDFSPTADFSASKFCNWRKQPGSARDSI